MLPQTLLGLIAAASVVSSSPAPRLPDPCQRATEEAQEAEARYWQWCANHSKRYGSCVPGTSARGTELRAAWDAALARRAQVCG